MDIYLPMCTCTHEVQVYGPSKGMGAPVTHDVSGHRALEKQQNNDIGVSLDV